MQFVFFFLSQVSVFPFMISGCGQNHSAIFPTNQSGWNVCVVYSCSKWRIKYFIKAAALSQKLFFSFKNSHCFRSYPVRQCVSDTHTHTDSYYTLIWFMLFSCSSIMQMWIWSDNANFIMKISCKSIIMYYIYIQYTDVIK